LATFYNQATLSYAGGSVRSNIATGEITEAATAVKTAISASYTPGGSVAYAVSIVNSGAADMTDVTVTDDLGGYPVEGVTVYPLTYTAGSLQTLVNGVPAPGPTAAGGPPLVISGITVPAGGSVVLLYEADVTAYAPLGADAEITNTVTVDGGGIVTPLTASATVPASTAPDLAITKTVSPETVTGNAEITYTFLIQNFGSEVGADANVVVTDTFDPILSGLTAALNGTALPTTAYTYSETTGQFATNAGQITVPAATYGQNTDGTWTVTPGVTVLTVTGTI